MRLGMGLGLGNLLSGQPLTGFPNDFSFNFDGSNDYLEAGESSALGTGTNFTISFWFKSESNSKAYMAQIQKGVSSSNIGVLANAVGGSANTGYVTVLVWNGSTNLNLSFDGSIDDEEWHHIAFTTTSSAQVLYFDGQSVDTDTIAFNNSFDSNPISIGARGGGSEFFDGLIDEFAIWDTVLDANTIAKLGSKPVDLTKYSASNLKLWLRAGDKVLPESDASIARSDFYTDFDGVDDYVDTSATFQSTFRDSFSISMWVKPSDGQPSGEQSFFGSKNSSNEDRIHCNLQADGDITFFYKSNNNAGEARTDNVAFPNGDTEWTHFSLVADNIANQLNIYKNGIKQAVAGGSLSSVTMSDWTSSDELFIGARDNNGTAELPYGGAISNLSIYKTALDAQTISQMAKSRFTPMRDTRFSVVDFDGTNDRIDVSATLSSSAYTVMGWVYKTRQDGSYFIDFRKDSGTGYLAFSNNSNNTIYAQSGTLYVNGVTGTTVPLNAWTHICVTGMTIESSIIKIACQNNDTNCFQGSYSSVSVYSSTKSAEEVYAIYQQGITYDESSLSGLQAYYRMGSDTSKAYPTIADSSSNSNDGTITNGASDDIVQQMVAGYDMGAFESTGQELDASLATSLTWNNNSYETFITSGNSITEAGNTSGHGICYSSAFSVTAGKVYKFTFNFTLNSGSFSGGVVRVGTATSMNSSNDTLVTSPSNGLQSYYYTPSSSSSSFLIGLRLDSGSFNFSFTDLSIQQVLQSDLSDTYPAIIDVNEPVLGAELVDNTTASQWLAYNNNTVTDVTNGVKITYVDDADGARALFSDAKILNTDLTVGKFYKVTFNAYYEGGSAGVLVRIYDSTAVVYRTPSLTTSDTSYTLYFKATHATNAQLYLQDFASSNIVYITNLSTKEVNGNVGTMTNQDSADLVYSSVLPDQSFLTGVNSAYNFIDLDGSDQYIDAGALDSALEPPLSISMWVKGDAQSGKTLIQDDSVANGILYTRAGNEISLYTSAGDKSYSYTLNNTWAHIVMTQASSAKPLVYVNGDLLSDGSQDFAPNPSFSNIRIGGDYGEFNGSIGQTAIWNKELSSTEVSAIYTLGRHGNLLDSYSDNLKGYWAMSALDASTGLSDSISTIYDRSGNSNHGTPQNADAGDLASSPNAEPQGYSKNETNRSNNTP